MFLFGMEKPACSTGLESILFIFVFRVLKNSKGNEYKNINKKRHELDLYNFFERRSISNNSPASWFLV